MAKTNGFFGQLQGPFTQNEELFTAIQNQCQDNIPYISKLGIHYVGDFNLDLQGIREGRQILVLINNEEFQIGKTRMLELQDVQITSIKFKQNMSELTFIDYQCPVQQE